MALHHMVSVFLYGGCYLYNAWEIGAVIALIHDIADISTSMIKVLAETSYKLTTVAVFLVHMAVWFYTRNYGLPLAIMKIYETKIDLGTPFNLHMFCYLLSCLVLLHYWWFYLFIKHLVKFATKGSTENEMDKIQTVKKVL
jgi:hypothetical protein